MSYSLAISHPLNLLKDLLENGAPSKSHISFQKMRKCQGGVVANAHKR